MSRILVFNRYRLHSAAFHRWLDPDHELFLLNCSSRAVDRHPDRDAIRTRYRDIAEFDDYVTNPEVTRTARNWIRRYGIDIVLAFSEHDVLRAAALRDEFGIAGQGTGSAEAFRDKLAMKRQLRHAAVPILPYAELGEPGDLSQFAREVGYPLLAKPRTGTGSAGIVRLDDPDSATAFAARVGRQLTEYLAEPLTPHELLHCDGVYADGRVVFAEAWSWTRTMLTVRDSPAPTIAVTLDLDDPRREPVFALAEDTLRALPAPRATAFHIEFFETSAGLVVNEAASRIGGGRIQPAIRRLHGIDLVELTACHQTGPGPTLAPRRIAPTAGFLLAYDNAGMRGFAPAACQLAGISHYETVLPTVTGEKQDVASSAYLLSGIAVGNGREQTRDRLLAFHRWFLDHLDPAG